MADGSASVGNITGGDGNYNYQWDLAAGGQISDTATNLAAGIYTVTVSDQNGCNLDTTITVLEPNAITIALISQDSTSCNGLNDGSAIIGNITGGNGIYSYQWDLAAGGQTTDTATNLGAGTYTVTVTDQNGCSKDTIVEVLQPDGINLTSSIDSATCGNADGMAIIIASGGSVTVDYLYSWEDNNGVDLNTNNDSLIGVASSYLYSIC